MSVEAPLGAPRRIVCVSDRVPSPSGSGGGLAAHGLGAALAASGYEVHCVVTNAPSQWDASQDDFSVHFVGKSNASDVVDMDQLRAMVVRLSPDVVWVFDTNSWSMFAPLRKKYPHVLYSLDPEWEIELLRRKWRKPPKDFPRKILYAFRDWRKVSELREKERVAFRQAAEFGVAAGFTASEVPGMRRRTGVDVRVCPLAFADWEMRRSVPTDGTPRALLLGNLESVHTRYGLRYFFDEVWPMWKDHKNRPRSEIRIVGGGRLPEHFDRPPEDARLKWIGFVASIEEEWNEATALLVPVPLENGIRSRIVEAWCRGVPVISHPGAEAGLPQMRPGVNYFSAERPNQWIEAICLLEEDHDKAMYLAENGRETYLQEFSAEAGARRFGGLTELAIRKFRSPSEDGKKAL